MPNTYIRFDQGFEEDSIGFSDETNGWSGVTTEVASGTNGIDAADGDSYSIFEQSDADGGLTGPFTRFDGYRSLAEDQGVTTQIKIYLDPTAWSAGEGFDYSVAANNQAGGHMQDFIFHVTQDTSSGDMLIGVSNNTNFDPREDLETINHSEVTEAGWYTFEHTFYDFGDDTLGVAMTVRDASGSVIFTQVLNDPNNGYSDEFGGNRYGWFTNIDVAGGIAVDSAQLLTESENPVQVFSGSTILGTYATAEDATAAIDNGDISGATLKIQTTGLDDAFFYVADGMSIQAAIDASAVGGRVLVADGTYNESLTIGKALTLEGEDVGGDGIPDVVLNATGSNGITVTGDIDNGGSATVSVSGFHIGGATGVGLHISNSAILSSLEISDSAFTSNGTHGVGSGSGASGLGSISIHNSAFTNNGQGGANGSGDIILFNFHGDASLTDLTITSSATQGTAVSARGDNAIQIAGFDPSTYDVSEPIGDIVINNVSVNGWYHKPQFMIQGFTDFNGLSMTDVDLSGGTSWGDLLFVDPIGSTGADGEGIPGYPGNFALTGGSSTLDLSGVTINSGSTGVLGVDSRIRGTDADDAITGTNGDDLLNDYAESGIDYGGDDFVSGLGGDDILIGGTGNDTLAGGSGDDTAVYQGNSTQFSVSYATNSAGVATSFTSVIDNFAGDGDEGSDVLSSVETLSFEGDGKVFDLSQPVQLFDASDILVATFDTIQEAIDAAVDGQTVRVGAGTFNEVLTIDKEIDIVGAGAGQTIIEGTLLDDLGVPDGMPLNDYFEANNPAYSASEGVTITADNVSFSGFTVTGFSIAMEIATSDGVSITNNEFIDNVTGMRKGTAQNVTNIEISNNSFSQGVHGMTIYAAPDGSGAFDGVDMDGNTFSALSEKGMYLEQISNATIDDNMFDDVGNFGRISPPFGGTQGEFGQAIDINLKYENYSGIVFNNTIITNSGYSNQDGGAGFGAFGAAIGVKTRDDAPSYSGAPASVTGAVVFNGGSIDGTSTGFRVGEPGKNNLGPDVQINGMSITNTAVSDVDNATSAVSGGLTSMVFSGAQVNFDGSASQAALAVTANGLANTITGGSGADVLNGAGGNDSLQGNAGSDFLSGGAGNDTVIGGFGDDQLFGGVGNDMLSGGDDNDVVAGGDGDDILTGGAGLDAMYGGAGQDSMDGGDGADIMTGNAGNDTLQGGLGNDTVIGGDNDDVVNGGDGNDQMSGTKGNDTVHGNQGSDVVVGGDGNDAVFGDDGHDTAGGGLGNDTVSGGAGNDTVVGGDGDDLLYGGTDNDELYGGLNNDSLWGGTGNDLLAGADGADVLNGEDGNDSLFGGNGADTLTGGAGDDQLFGNADNDVLFGGGGFDTLNGGGGDDLVNGGADDDMLLGDVGNDTLNGSGGDDEVKGGAGNDLMFGDIGEDTMIGGAGNDTLDGGAGDDLFVYTLGDGNDVINGFVAGAAAEDAVQLIGFGSSFDDFADVLAAATDNGVDTTIDLGGGASLTITGVLVAELHEGDFLFGVI